MARSFPVKTVVGILAVVVIIVGAVVVYPTIGLGLTAGRTTTSSGTSTSSAPSSVLASSSSTSSSTSTPTPTVTSTSTSSTTTASSSSSSVSSTTSSSSTLGEPFNFAITSSPNTILLAPGGNLTYPSVELIPLPSASNTRTDMVTLSVTAPAGIRVSFVESMPVKFSLDQLSLLNPDRRVQFALAASSDLAPGDYKVAVVATSGSISAENSFTVRVTPYLVIVKDAVYYPAKLTVKAGTTVYWINLGFPTGGDNAQEFDVYFNTINAHSGVLTGAPKYESFSYTFNTPGTYDYYCVQADDCIYPYMMGEVVVTG